MPTRSDLPLIWQGDTTSLQFQAMQDDDTPLDLTGSEILFRLQWVGGEIERTSDDGGVVLVPGEGRATISFTAEETAALNTGLRHRFDLRRIIGGNETTLIYGYAAVNRWVRQDG